MLRNRKTGAFVLAGLAAFAYYRYSKMTPGERTQLTSTLKDKAKSLVDQLIPGGLGNVFGDSAKIKEHANSVTQNM